MPFAGLLSGLAGHHGCARAQTAQAGTGMMYELEAIVAAAIGGTVILGLMTSGFTFLRIDAYYQEIVKGVIIVAAIVADDYRQKKRRRA